MKKFINRIKWHLKELNKTFSNIPSFYSSKRIERFILFINGLVIFDLFCWSHRETMEFQQAAEALAINLVYAGFIIKQLQKENKPTDATTTVIEQPQI